MVRITGVCLVALSLLFVAARADEEKVPLDKVPKAVLDAVKARFPDAKIESAEKETDKDKTVYEIAIKNKEQSIEVTLTPEGKIVEIEKQIAAKDLPKAVAATLESKYAKATYKIVEEIIHVKDGKESMDYYEVHLVTAQGKELEVRVAPDGKFVGEEEQKKEEKKETKKKK